MSMSWTINDAPSDRDYYGEKEPEMEQPQPKGYLTNFYIEIPPEALRMFNDYKALLKEKGVKFFDATKYDSYTSGPNALDSIEEIEEDLKQARLCYVIKEVDGLDQEVLHNKQFKRSEAEEIARRLNNELTSDDMKIRMIRYKVEEV